MKSQATNSQKPMYKPADDKNKPEGKMRKGNNAVLTAVLTLGIILIVLAGVLFLIIHNNVSGLADRYRTSLAEIPLLRNALPAATGPVNLDKLTKAELIKKYGEIEAENSKLLSKLKQEDNELVKLQQVKDEYDKMKSEIDGTKSDLKSQQAALDKKKSEVDDYKKQVDAIVANGDKSAFSQYYEKLNPDVAKQIYAEIVKQQQTDTQIKKFATLYATMDASSAAQIFEKMGSTKIDMIAETLMAMNKEASSAILAAMTPSFSAKLTEKLNALYKGQ